MITKTQQEIQLHHQRAPIIMSPEDAASGRRPDPFHGLDIVGSVRNLSPSLWNMTHLTSLFLNDNCLTRLPADIGRLTQLRLLDLSSNRLRSLPPELGDLILLEELLLDDNQLRKLPLELGKLFHLRRLGLKGNAPLNQELLQIYQEPKGTQKLITYLLDLLAYQFPAPRPPQRPWILKEEPVNGNKPSCMFTTMCYNVLSDPYTTRQLYGYCPNWALSWNYRKELILEELKGYSADIIALQEVETEQYQKYFLRELQAEGYDGVFSPKSRAKTMSESERKHVDGCAIFYKTSKFSLISEHLIEFNQLAMANAEGSDDMLNRVMTKDNIALVALLQIKDGAFDSFQPGEGGTDSGGASGAGGEGNTPTSVSGNSGTIDRNGVMFVGGGAGGGGNATGSSNNNNSTINVSTQPLHLQRLLVCNAHMYWDPEFCDVKLIQTIMLTHELQAIANQAAKDLLASSGENINSIKQYYLRNGRYVDPGGQTNHFGGGGGGGSSGRPMSNTNSSSSPPTNTTMFNDQDDFVSGGDDSHLDQLGSEIIPIIMCGDYNSLPESSVVEFLTNGGISADHPDFKELAYKDCLRKICNSKYSAMANSQHSQQNQQLSGQSSKSSSSSTSSSTDEQQQKSSNNDSITNTSNGNGNQKQQRSTTKYGAYNTGSTNSTTNNSESIYTHPFPIATAYSGRDNMPYTNYTFDFKGVIDYIFYSKNLMSVLGVSGLDKTWLVENKIPGLPHPYFPSDHFPLYVELEILPSPRSAPVNRYKQQKQQNHQQQQQQSQLQSQHPQRNKQKNDFIQTPTMMRKSYFGT